MAIDFYSQTTYDAFTATDWVAQARDCLVEVKTFAQLNTIKAYYLGQSGVVNKRLRQIGQLPKRERAAAGAANNQIRVRLEALFSAKSLSLEESEKQAAIKQETLDVTMPGRRVNFGALHPLQQTIDRAVGILKGLGFEIAQGPEIENDYYNFTALNIPPKHPARDMHDTIYLKDNHYLLRTHTSPVQVRYMQSNHREKKAHLPTRIISPGRAYRRDHDANHSPMFHQIEGLWIDSQACFTDLKGVLGSFFRAFFANDELVIRFRPSFFPFTEPSAECDISHGEANQWLEIAGCGMVHPNVLAESGIDSNEYQGFAFGMGVERLAMIYYKIDDIRLFFENDMRFLSQYGR